MDSPRLKTIFSEALARQDGPERAAYLDEACRGDAGLRSQVETLLNDHERIGRFLGTATGSIPSAGHGPEDLRVGDITRAETPDTCGPAGPRPGAEGPGATIGPYKLLQQIGEGGMGTVYMAEQTQPVRRKVALKVIKAGMDSRQVVARFEAERQALAMMDHVNIARVLDAGATDSGRPYFVMELVHGVPITKYCDDNHLTPRQRLELFVPVCQAIQHAHQKGIIHRDIKPSNVMVTLYDGKPVPKVIDFGVAKATEQKLTERTLFTQYGTLVGTLEYMSPEQAEMSALGIDTRSDIYSLGVLLYELLTGSTPLSRKRVKEAAFAEILRLIREEEPPRPSTRLSDSGEALASISAQRHTEPARLTKLVRGELDWIVMKTPGEGPQPPLRDGQRLRNGCTARFGGRGRASVPAIDGLSASEVRAAEQAARAGGRVGPCRAPGRHHGDHLGHDPRHEGGSQGQRRGGQKDRGLGPERRQHWPPPRPTRFGPRLPRRMPRKTSRTPWPPWSRC